MVVEKLKKMGNAGYEKGNICNRSGCGGVIKEHEKEGSCSCHINPPCGYCTENTAYCEECGWDAQEEQRQYYLSRPEQTYPPFKVKTINDLDPTKIDYIIEHHTHFTQKAVGVYPDGVTPQEVRAKVNGTFGGRFTRFHDGKFAFIAYTD